MFPKGGDGFFGRFQIALFAFVGVELIGTMAAETKDPEKNLPKAVSDDSNPYHFVLCLVIICSDVGDTVESNPCGSKPVRFTIFTCGYPNFSHHYELGGAVFSDVFNE